MNQNKTIIVNGQTYDTVTGLPVPRQGATKPATPTPPATEKPLPNARSLHASTQRSTTLRRSIKKKAPVAPPKTSSTQSSAGVEPRKRPTAKTLDIARHPQVGKFTAASGEKTASRPAADIAPRQHPHALKAEQRVKHKKQQPTATPASAKQIKETEIAKALAAAKPASTKKPKRAKKQHSHFLRMASLVVLAVILISALAWFNLPALSVRVASLQSGVSASFPHYTPEGYRLRLPVSAESNRVVMTFLSSQNDVSFNLSQEKSAWDSQAVRAMIEERSKGQFLTTNDRGLTIYTYNGNAAWVNKGTLYTVTGDAPLANDTIMRIASSI